mmetsp:Transcript_16970/g.45720  ORF Transcript_16970/g.45720 Transcript_16970/m.45720 type:complete len:233 (+) Transcript_16970:916-1614(+)
MRVALSHRPVALGQGGAGMPPVLLVCGLGGEEELVRPAVLHLRHVPELIPSVPVEGNAVEVLRHGRVRERGLGPLHHVVLVVVEGEDLDAWLLLAQDRAQAAGHPLHHLRGVVHAGIPASGVLGLVLKGDAPDGHVVLLVRIDPAREVVGPDVVAVPAQAGLLAACHLLILASLHPGGGRPGTCEHVDGAPVCLLHGRLDHGDHGARIMVHGVVKVLEVKVLGHVVKGVGVD